MSLRIVFAGLALFVAGIAACFAQNQTASEGLPAHCADARVRDTLRALGPVASVGASASSGMLARSFPLMVANQLCLTPGDGYEALHDFGGGDKFKFLKQVFIEKRPKIIIALDHLHHSSKRRRFDAAARAYIDAELAMLTLDCNHALVDCKPGGEFEFVRKENYRPLVLLGDIYAFYAESCAHSNPLIWTSQDDPNVGCIEDYEKINGYLWARARELPGVIMFPVDRFYRNLHRGLPFLYDHGGQLGNFFARDLFWDGFHPRSEPGAPVLANLVIAHLNARLGSDSKPRVGLAPMRIPYAPIDPRCFKPFTGVALANDGRHTLPADQPPRLVTRDGATLTLPFAASPGQPPPWLVTHSTDLHTRTVRERAGENPLMIAIEVLDERGAVVLTGEQQALLARVLQDSRHRLRGGIVVDAR